MPLSHPRTRSHLYLMLACLLFLPDMAKANPPHTSSCTIGKMARIFNARWVELENRIAWLNSQLAPLVPQQNPGLHSHFCIRCGRLKEHDPCVAVSFSQSRKWNDLSVLLESVTVSHHQRVSFGGPVTSTSSINTLTPWWPEIFPNGHRETGKPEGKLPLDAKRHLFLFYKEAVQNILKNSQARHTYIRISDMDAKLALKIYDDGIGLTSEVDHRNVLIHRLEKRNRMLDGSLLVHRSMKQEISVRLLVKRSYLNLHSSLS